MKKTFTLLCLALSAGVFAQTFSVYRTTIAGAITGTVQNNGGYVVPTVAGSPQHPATAIEDHLLIQNHAATTQTFNVTRSVVMQSPNLILDGDATHTPNTYFCFGNTCFGSDVNTPDAGNHTILAAANQTFILHPNTSNSVTIFDDSGRSGEPFVIYFTEGSVQGSYIVQYRVFNLSDPNDTLVFKIGYNQQSVGIKNQTATPADLVSEIYPNPLSGSKVYFNLSKDEELKFQVYNSLGSLVASSSRQKFTAGKNQLPVDSSELSNGLYFVTISSNAGTVTKRLIVTNK